MKEEELSLGARGLLACLMAEQWGKWSMASVLAKLSHPERFGFRKKEADEAMEFLVRTKLDFEKDDERKAEKERHYLWISETYAQENGDELAAGYWTAFRVKRLPAPKDVDPWIRFTESRYCQEDYMHLRRTLKDSKPFCIGWAVALEELRDRAAPIRALAELF